VQSSVCGGQPQVAHEEGTVSSVTAGEKPIGPMALVTVKSGSVMASLVV